MALDFAAGLRPSAAFESVRSFPMPCRSDDRRLLRGV